MWYFSESEFCGTRGNSGGNLGSGISDLRFPGAGSWHIYLECQIFAILKISRTWLSSNLLYKSDHFNCRSREISKFEKFLLFENSEISRFRQLKWSLLHNKKTMNQVCDIFLNQNSVELEENREIWEAWESSGRAGKIRISRGDSEQSVVRV